MVTLHLSLVSVDMGKYDEIFERGPARNDRPMSKRSRYGVPCHEAALDAGEEHD